MFKNYSQKEYRDALLALLPQGAQWKKERETVNGDLYLLVEGWAEEFARLDQRIRKLNQESVPSAATETLQEWEKDFGLKVPSANTTEKRRANILCMDRGEGFSSDEPNITTIASEFGYDIILEQPYKQQVMTFGNMRFKQRWYNLRWNIVLNVRTIVDQPAHPERIPDDFAIFSFGRRLGKRWYGVPYERQLKATVLGKAVNDEAYEKKVRSRMLAHFFLTFRYDFYLEGGLTNPPIKKKEHSLS